MFDLVGPDQELIYVQGPFQTERLPGLEDMRAPEQQLTALGSTNGRQWVEFAYEYEACAWMQRHYVIPLNSNETLVVTMQTPQEHASRSIAAADAIAQTLEPFQSSA